MKYFTTFIVSMFTLVGASPTAMPTVAPTSLLYYSAPDLGECERFAIHGHAGVAASGDLTEVEGDVGGDNAITGFGTPPLPHVNDTDLYGYYEITPESNLCAADKGIAYRAAMAATCTGENAATPADLSGITLGPGVYCNSATYFILTAGDLTLDGGNDTDSVFIFQAASHIHTAINTEIVLTNGALAKNVFWVAGSSITLSGYSVFVGNLLAYASITLGTGTELYGRALAGTASVTLAGLNIVNLP
jgi:hypothetical protein